MHARMHGTAIDRKIPATARESGSSNSSATAIRPRGPRTSSRVFFSATSLPVTLSRALYTLPYVPSPIFSSFSYWSIVMLLLGRCCAREVDVRSNREARQLPLGRVGAHNDEEHRWRAAEKVAPGLW
jgi:hypothetical protein